MTIWERTPRSVHVIGCTIAALGLLLSLTASAPASPAPAAQMWDIVQVDSWEIRVRSIERRSDPLPAIGADDAVRPRGQFALVVVDLTNLSATPRTALVDAFALTARSGSVVVNRSDTPFGATYAAANDFLPFGSEVAPGETVMTVLVFEIDPRATGLSLSIGGGERRVRLDECKCSLPLPSEQVR